ncbi:MAG: sigma-70 family RNA polymerase sigma factor [Gemmatimonadota bacterium]|nr:sigma-70 family RNA polymerase sigma factor [Gemmatimonadota bacterium]
MTDVSTERESKRGFNEEALPHLDAVYRFALRLSESPDHAADLVQETFLRAYRSWEQYTRGTRVKSWLFTICRNVYLRGRERSQRHDELVEKHSERDDTLPDPVNPIWATVDTVDPEGAFFDSIVDGKILDAIDALPEEHREAVRLSDLEGLTYQEVADLLDVPVGTVKSRLFRGRRRLQAALYEYAIERGYVPAGSVSSEGG